MATVIQGTEVRIERNPTDWRKFQVVVAVHSIKKDKLKATNEIDPKDYPGVEKLIQAVGIAAGACAEYLGQKHGDNIDPSGACKHAIRAFGEECRLIAELGKDVEAKIKRLEHHKYLMTPEQVEQLQHMRYLVDHRERILPSEVQWINERLAPIHGSQL